MRVSDGLNQLKRIAPHRSTQGQLYAKVSETKGAWTRVRFWTLFVSDEQDWLLRDHVFDKKQKAMDAKEWAAWFAKNLDDITAENILPGLAVRTGLQKQWAVKSYLGWRPDAFNVVNIAAKTGARNNRTQARRSRG